MSRFYNFANATEESVDLFINGEITDDETQTLMRSWFGEDVGTCPGSFIDELKENFGKNVNVYIDSYGGDVFAASSIYTALKEHVGSVTVKITGVAASAASVIAMAGSKVLMSKTAVMMIHNPSTGTYGDHNDMEKAIEILNTIKESIINAYEAKTGMDREKISELMENETWMDYETAREYGFCDGTIEDDNLKNVVKNCIENRIFVYNSLRNMSEKRNVETLVAPVQDVKDDNADKVDRDDMDDKYEEKRQEQLDRYMKLMEKM